jgi:glycosyltransferase involved in cell wall biosynthesis
VFPKVIPSFLQKIPFAKDRHEFLGSLTPIAFEGFDFSGFDVVVSVTSEAAKGILTKPQTRHICYCLTPTRYLWSAHDFYFKKPPAKFRWIPFFRTFSRPFVKYLQVWDKIAAQRPDVILGISSAVKDRIDKYYHRDARVIFPPVELDKFIAKTPQKKDNFYLLVSRLIPYKRVDLAVRAFNKMGLPLVIVGVGSEDGRLRAMAKNNIAFVGELTDEKLANYYRRCTALIFPQEEDFGIVVVEAQAAGTPVVAYKAGGALDTVIDGVTGIFFEKQSTRELIRAVMRLSSSRFVPENLINNARRFSKESFKKEFSQLIENGRN